jgi:hypothetical protein
MTFPRCACTAILVVAVLLAVSPARAGEDQPLPTGDAAVAAASGAFLPATVPAQVRPGGTMAAFSGVDGRSSGAAFTMDADLHLIGPVALHAGVTYLPGRPDKPFAPNLGARVQVARQPSLGVNVALALFWRRELVTDDDGLIEAVVAVDRRVGRLSGFAHLGYGQDDEGDDRQGEASLGGLLAVGERTHLGFNARLRFDLLSTDPRRGARGEPGLDLVVGPTASVALGSVALLGQVGYAGVRKDSRYQGGLLALGGLGLAF